MGSSIDNISRGFENAKRVDEAGNETWSARDLMPLLGYGKWQRFREAIDRAIESAHTSGYEVADHFTGAGKMISLGKGGQREVEDYSLSRLACYLIAQNGDPRKPPIAAAQAYFASQTRKQELQENLANDYDRLEARAKLKDTQKEFKGNIYGRGVRKQVEIAGIEDDHNKAIYGGKSTRVMKKKLGVPTPRPLADFESPVILKAKDLSLALSNENIEKKDLNGRVRIGNEVVDNGKAVRKTLLARDFVPESKPPEEDIKLVERRVKLREKLLDSDAPSLLDAETD